MSHEEKFNAAVNVIRNLPKNGAYQPSHELMLRFYAYYKQATEGPNVMPKPNFWEVTKRAKWEAWTKLGNLSREQAMINYVEELKKIVETMAYTDNVASFITSLDSFYESVPVEDLQLLIGPVIEKVRSQPGSPLSGSPLASRESSPQRVSTKASTKHITSSLETSPASSYSASPLPPDTDEEEDFLDTFEQTETERSGKEPNSIMKNKHHDPASKAMNGSAVLLSAERNDRGRHRDRNNSFSVNNKISMPSGVQKPKIVEPISNGPTLEIPNKVSTVILPPGKERKNDSIELHVSEVINQTLSSLQNHLDNLSIKLNTVERNYQKLSKEVEKNKTPHWWPLQGVPIPAALFFVIWPFVIQGIILWIQRRKRHV